MTSVYLLTAGVDGLV